MKELLKFLYPYIRPYKSKIVSSILLSFVLAGIKGAQAYLVKPIFDKGLSPDSSFEESVIFALILLGLGLLNFPARFFHFYWIRYVVDRATCELRSEVYKKLQRLPLSFFNANKQGNLISNILTDTSVLSQGFRNSVDIIREPVTALVMFSLAVYRDWQLTLVVIAVTPLFLVIFNISGKKVRSSQAGVQEHAADMTHNIAEGLAGQKVAKAFNLQGYVLRRFHKAQEKYFNFQMKTTAVEELAHPLVELVGAIAFSGVIVFAWYRIQSGEMSTGDFISFVTALALLMDPIRKYSQANVKLNQARAAGERIIKLLDLPVEKDGGTIKKEGFEDKISIENLTFSYGDGAVLENFTMTINKGEKVALVGLSGSGKSTLISLLLRLYDVERGKIFIDGVDINDFSLKSLRNLFGLVNQDIFLFNDTIEENLKLRHPFSDEQVAQAIEVAGAKEFVDYLPKKKETLIGDRGTRLSGGQAQRITIARAFLLDPEIFLFDEATSALDNESEKLVQAALERIAGDKTVIAVAHRLTTIQNFDKIITMKDGKIIEFGTHQQLLEMKGEYHKLYQLSMT